VAATKNSLRLSIKVFPFRSSIIDIQFTADRRGAMHPLKVKMPFARHRGLDKPAFQLMTSVIGAAVAPSTTVLTRNRWPLADVTQLETPAPGLIANRGCAAPTLNAEPRPLIPIATSLLSSVW
jgi:hypothetical protein